MSNPWHRIKGSSLLGDVAKLVSGASMGQLLTLLALLVAGRMFDDEAFGRLAIFSSIVAAVSPVASLRYDLAVMLPKQDEEARVVVALSRRIVLAVSVVVTVCVGLFQHSLTTMLGDQYLAIFLILCGPSVYLVGETNIYRYWMNRRGSYGDMARNSVWLAAGAGAGQVGSGMLGLPGTAALVGGQLLGQAIAWIRAFGQTRDSRLSGPSTFRRRDVARKYIKMPLLNGLNAVADSVRLSGINMLIAAESVSTLGQYSMAWKFTMAPVTLINTAIGQVLFRRFAQTPNGALTKFLLRTCLQISAISALLFVGLYTLAPMAFPLLLGSDWGVAGELGGGGAPWLALMLVSSPISTVFIVAGRQGTQLIFAAAYAATPLAYMSLYEATPVILVTGLGWIMAALLLANIAIAISVAIKYDGIKERDAPRD